MEQPANTNTIKASGALCILRGLLGLLLSTILIILLITNGLVIPVKTAFIKGDSLKEMLENSNVYEMLYEIANEAFEKNYPEHGISSTLYKMLLTEDTFKEICIKSTDAVMNNEAIDLSFLNESIFDSLKKEVNSTIDNAFEEITASNHKVIDANVLASNTALTNFKNNYGIDVSGAIMSAISSQYGIESIDLNYVDISTVKSFVITESMNNTVYPEIEAAVSSAVSDASKAINAELENFLNGRDIKSDIILFEASISNLKLLITIVFIVIAIIVIIQLIMYHSCIYKALRNISISALLPGLIIAGLGIFSSAVLPTAIKEIAAEFDSTAFAKFTEQLIEPLFDSFTKLGRIYLAAFAICLILSIVFKIIYKKQNTIYY